MRQWCKHNKSGLLRLLSTLYLGCGVSGKSTDNGVFLHDEADITLISYLFQAADAGRQVVQIRTNAAGLLDVRLRSSGSCCCADG